MTDFQFIKYEKKDRIAYLTLNRPDVLNAMHPPAHQEIAAAMEDFNADNESWVAIISGAGERAFCAGMDLRYRPPEGEQPAPMPPGGFGGLTNPRYYSIWKPIIAAVHGFCLGGGLELAMACDVIIAADNTQLGLPEARRGTLPGGMGQHRLPRKMPANIAMGYLLTGKTMTAEEASRYMLVNEVVPVDQLMTAAERWAAEIMEAAPLSIRAIKQAALQGLDMSLDEAANTEFEAQKAVRGSEDAREGRTAFAERRKPVWQAR
jgi:enoyl-CoA hydratase/carnithine racemase